MNIELMGIMVKKELPKALDYLEEKGTPVYVVINEDKKFVVITLDPHYDQSLQRWADIRDSYPEFYADCN